MPVACMTLTHAIEIETHRLGFALVGVTSPVKPPHYDAYEAWLTRGRHAGMTYLARVDSRMRRADPHNILPDCRSIIILGMPYPKTPTETSLPALKYRGNVASYAWDEDYHLSIPPRLNALVAFIESWTGKAIPHACYTDSGQILERDLAQCAGLGWIGKNTNIINPKFGSYFLLAEILLGIELEISQPFDRDRCGTCQRCIEACPTHCILPDRTLDASRCISYLTIENKGSIPIDLREKIGNWVFGCDICQQVCPWNKRVNAPMKDNAFSPQLDITHPDLIKALTLTPEAFNHMYRRSPIKRAKRAGYLRNVTVALGNQLSEIPTHPERVQAIDALERALLHDPSPLVRGHAAWALGKSGEKVTLHQTLPFEKDTVVLEEIQSAINM